MKLKVIASKIDPTLRKQIQKIVKLNNKSLSKNKLTTSQFVANCLSEKVNHIKKLKLNRPVKLTRFQRNQIIKSVKTHHEMIKKLASLSEKIDRLNYLYKRETDSIDQIAHDYNIANMLDHQFDFQELRIKLNKVYRIDDLSNQIKKLRKEVTKLWQSLE